jgi:uncharacterized coiled-coil DUF342 family protein
MQNFQRNLFILLAVALCGTCAYQWYLQANQLGKIETLNQSIYEKAAAIQTYTNSLKLRDDDISQLQDRVTQLKQTMVSNDSWALDEKRLVVRLKSDGDILSNAIVQYRGVVDDLTNKLDKAYTGEKELAAQRDEFVKKLNDSITAQNALTTKYNQLVDRFNQLQTNAPNK